MTQPASKRRERAGARPAPDHGASDAGPASGAIPWLQSTAGNRAVGALLGDGSGVQRAGVSFELQEGPKMSVPTKIPGLNEDQMVVLAWLREKQNLIVAAEAKYRVDRRAIAGAIAWEALENVRSAGITAVGPGKPHLLNRNKLLSIGESSEDTFAKQVEDAGYLPKQTYDDRKKILETAAGSIEYIGAIMAASADIAGRYGYDIRCDPPILTQVYNSKDIHTWEAHLKKKGSGGTLVPGVPMALWVRDNDAFLVDAVGESPLKCGPATTPAPKPDAGTPVP